MRALRIYIAAPGPYARRMVATHPTARAYLLYPTDPKVAHKSSLPLALAHVGLLFRGLGRPGFEEAVLGYSLPWRDLPPQDMQATRVSRVNVTHTLTTALGAEVMLRFRERNTTDQCPDTVSLFVSRSLASCC